MLTVAARLILLRVLNLTGTPRWLQENIAPNLRLLAADTERSDSAAKSESPTPKLRSTAIFKGLGLFNVLRPLVIGIVHNLAGSAAVALLVMTTIHNPWWAIVYLFLFGIGTITGMMLITAVLAMPFAFTLRRFSGFNRGLAVASGLLSLGFGLFLSYQIGFVDGLFSSHPRWTPH